MSMKNLKDNGIKIAIYGANIFSRPVGTLINSLADTNLRLGNPVGACLYAGLDIAGVFSKEVKDSKYVSLSKILGAGAYGLQTFGGLWNLLEGDVSSLEHLPFDASMTYQLAKDSIESYKGSKSVLEDLKNVGKDIKNMGEKVSKKYSAHKTKTSP